jgi:HD-GYP domain-containing protein (c-di-GMP phosphodiesterase class II)
MTNIDLTLIESSEVKLMGSDVVAEDGEMIKAKASIEELVEKLDPDTQAHSRRVAMMAIAVYEQLAKKMGVTPSNTQLKAMESAALGHDVGKIFMEYLVTTPRALNRQEQKTIQGHEELTEFLLTSAKLGKAEGLIIAAAASHHETVDGCGPRGLREVPLEAQVVEVADVYDALVMGRPYKAAWNTQTAVEYIREMKGTKVSPLVEEAFERVITKITGYL